MLKFRKMLDQSTNAKPSFKVRKFALKAIAATTMMVLLGGHSMLGIVAAYEWLAPDEYIEMLDICFETDTSEVIRHYIPRASIFSRNIDEIIMPRNKYGEIEWCFPSFDYIGRNSVANAFPAPRTGGVQEQVMRLSDRGSYRRTLLYTFNWKSSISTPRNGTAFVVAPHVLMTAAHAVFQYGTMMPAANPRIHIGQHATTPNNDYVHVIGASIPVEWKSRSRNSNGSHDFDWAFLRTRENLVSRVGSFGIRRTYSNDAVMAGYPSAVGRHFFLHRAIGDHHSSTARVLRSNMQVFGGQSGGPVFQNSGGIVFAVISAGNERDLVFSNRITDQVIAEFNRVRNAWS